MALTDKYAALVSAANAAGASNLQVREQDNVLYIDGEVSSGEIKDQLWSVYDKIDPDYRSGDLVMNINVSPAAPSTRLKVTTQSSNLNIRKGPGTDQPIIGKAAHNSVVTLLSRYNDSWSLIRTDNGEEGYCATQYLTQI
jgi:uncharacterized protein YgiM (DUF1202 family)